MINNFYFTFGNWEKFPFQNGYLIVRAETFFQAIRIFKAKYPNSLEDLVNCSDYYGEIAWNKMNLYGDQKPFEILSLKTEVP